MDIVVRGIFFILMVVRLAILVRVLLAWVHLKKDNKFIVFIYQITEPILDPVRKMLQKTKFGQNATLDLAPIATFLIILLLETIISAATGITSNSWF